MRKHSRQVVTYQLSAETSSILIPCYARHGKGRFLDAPLQSDLIVIMINKARQIRECPAYHSGSWDTVVEGVPARSEWRYLGWRMADGSLPHGEYDQVDPEMAEVDKLPYINAPMENYGSAPPT